jgi:hypothetical protein
MKEKILFLVATCIWFVVGVIIGSAIRVLP